MKRRGHFWVSACLAFSAGTVAAATAAEDAVLAQDLVNVRASNKIAAAIWTHRADAYTLQVVLAQSVCQPLAASAAAARTTATAQQTDDGNRSSFFIGNTIANLRGLDPTYGGCTLTLIDARRATPDSAAQASVRPPVDAPRTPAAVPSGAPPRIQVWLLGADGTQIIPEAVSAESPTANGCGSRCLTNEILYRFPLAQSAQAAAIAISVDDQYYIEKLRKLE